MSYQLDKLLAEHHLIARNWRHHVPMPATVPPPTPLAKLITIPANPAGQHDDAVSSDDSHDALEEEEIEPDYLVIIEAELNARDSPTPSIDGDVAALGNSPMDVDELSPAVNLGSYPNSPSTPTKPKAAAYVHSPSSPNINTWLAGASPFPPLDFSKKDGHMAAPLKSALKIPGQPSPKKPAVRLVSHADPADILRAAAKAAAADLTPGGGVQPPLPPADPWHEVGWRYSRTTKQEIYELGTRPTWWFTGDLIDTMAEYMLLTLAAATEPSATILPVTSQLWFYLELLDRMEFPSQQFFHTQNWFLLNIFPVCTKPHEGLLHNSRSCRASTHEHVKSG